MTPTEKHPYLNWEVSIMELPDKEGIKYKVTRRLTELNVAETKVFRSKEEAKSQFEQWLK